MATGRERHINSASCRTVLPQRVADLPRREPEDARDLRLSPARLFHGFDERVFAKLRKMTIDFTR